MSSNETKTWKFDFWDESECLHHIRYEVEELSNSTVQEAVLAQLDTNPDLYDLTAWVNKQLTSTEFEAADEETQAAWEEIGLFTDSHKDSNCMADTWEHFGMDDWAEWLKSIQPDDACQWVLVDSEDGYYFDAQLSAPFTTEALCEALGNAGGWVSLAATYEPEQRTLQVDMNTGSGILTGSIYAPTVAEEQCVRDLDFADPEGVYAYLASEKDTRLLNLIETFLILDTDIDTALAWVDVEGGDHFYDAVFATKRLLGNIPEESHEKLYELAPTWPETKSVHELCIEAVASTLTPHDRSAFRTLASETSYGDDLKPLVKTAKTIMTV